jgi:glycosyltransferase involved in cell wall biosynthesis
MSEMWRSELISRGVPADRIFLLPNGVDTNVFRPSNESERLQLRHSMGFAPDDIVIGFSGQSGHDHGWRKGVDVFLNALQLLVEQGLRIAAIVGGPGWGDAVAKIRAMRVKVFWRPYVLNSEDGAPMYRALDFFWVTSRIEGGPVPLLEAMSSGVCCISTKVGFAPEVIKDGVNGCLVDIEDATRIAALTSNLLGDVEKRNRMGNAARSAIVAEYDWSQTAKQAVLLYQTTMLNFEQRYSPLDKQKSPAGDQSNAILSPQDARWLAAQEQLTFSRELCRMGERRAAFTLGWRASLAYPFSIRTWSFLANLILPMRVLELMRYLRVG